MGETDQLHQILAHWGSRPAERASDLLTQDVQSELLLAPLRSLAQHRRDLIRSSLVVLACEAVGGAAEEVLPAAVAMVLEGYYLGLIDDVVDKSREKLFRPTLSEKFGVDVALIVSIIVDAKAHHVLVELLGKLDHDKYLEVHRVFKDFLVRMIEGEALNVEVKKRGFVNSKDLLRVFARQSADIEACTQLGAIIGGGSKKDVELLATYGRSLGTLLLLNDDNRDAFNLTLELEDKIRSGSYPYPLMWAANHSTEFKQLLQSLHNKKRISPNDAKQCVTLLFESGTIAHVKDLMEKMAAEAVSTLEALNDTEAKRALEVIAESQPCRVLGQSLSFLP